MLSVITLLIHIGLFSVYTFDSPYPSCIPNTCTHIPRWCVVKNMLANAGDSRDMSLIPGSGRSLEKGIPTPVSLPGKFHGQRSLVGCIPWGHKESDMTERLSTHPSHIPKHMYTYLETNTLNKCNCFQI